MRRPKQPLSRPFTVDSPETTAILISPVKARAKSSGGVKFIATLARSGQKSTRITPPRNPPMELAEMANPTASGAIPFWAMG